jgi:hypothetical protein
MERNTSSKLVWLIPQSLIVLTCYLYFSISSKILLIRSPWIRKRNLPLGVGKQSCRWNRWLSVRCWPTTGRTLLCLCECCSLCFGCFLRRHCTLKSTGSPVSVCDSLWTSGNLLRISSSTFIKDPINLLFYSKVITTHLSYPAVIIPILFESTSASSIEWVVKITALFFLHSL